MTSDERIQSGAADAERLPSEVLRRAAVALQEGATARARRLIDQALARSPGDADALRLAAMLHAQCQRQDQAVALLQRGLELHPDNAMLHNDLGNLSMARGERDAAFASWRRATECDPRQAMPWYNLGRNLQLEGSSEDAAEALGEAHRLQPELLPAAILLGDALTHLGRFDEADAAYRDALAIKPDCGDAWRGLSNIKTRPLSAADATRLSAQLARDELAIADRIAMGHAMGKLEEDRGRFSAALAVLTKANNLNRSRAPWNQRQFEDYVAGVIDATLDLPAPASSQLGQEAIFVVGLPRSGTTLLEQILASHPEVEGAGELNDLGAVIEAESRRRGVVFPAWLADADTTDWQRLGLEYLQRTSRWRGSKPRSADKLPENWKLVGILRAMLPGAIVIDVRRDPLETAWSCYRQQFYRLPHFACDFGHIGAYLRGHDRAMDTWRERDPGHIFQHRHEDLLAAPEQQIRSLLANCGLPFDPRCLEFHLTKRSVRSASAAQVRQPLQRDIATASRYGELLDPLRAALGTL